ncbi:hypothetical protein QQG55_13240 [Brugia pahangi]
MQRNNSEVMYPLLDLLTTKVSEVVLIDNYTSHGLIIFGGNTLWFVVGLYSGADKKAYYNRKIKLYTDPPLPLHEKFKAMFVNGNSTSVALSSEHSVFVVELPYDFWCRQSVTENPVLDHLQPTYHCRNQFVDPYAKSKNTVVDILKIRWCRKEKYECGHHTYSRLAILYSENIVRIYDTDISCDTPTVVIDFKSILGPSESSCGRSFGVHNYIASFDFGPSFARGDNEIGAQIGLKTLFAIDNDCGDIYIAIYSNNRVIEMQGPLTLTGIVPGDFACSGALDMLYVQYREDTSLPIFSLISPKGCITHFLALTLQQETFNGHVEFILAHYDNVLLPCKPLADISYCLQNDSIQPGQYFVFCGANLFSIDINPWAHLLSDLFRTKTKYDKHVDDLPDSKVHHVFAVLGNKEIKETADAIRYAATAYATNEKVLDNHLMRDFNKKDIIYVAITSSKQLLHKFTRYNGILYEKNVIARRYGTPVEEQIETGDYLLEECMKILESQTAVPSLKLNESITEAQGIAAANSIVETLVKNMKVTQVAFKKVHDIITNNIMSSGAIINNKSVCTERLLRLLSTYVDLKNRIYKIQATVAQLKKRSDELGSGLAPKMFPLTDSEKAMNDKLETLRIDVDGIMRQIPYLANEVATKRRDRFGPVRSFCASMNAQKFMLSKNTEDINEMVSWTKKLIKKIDSIQTNLIAEDTSSTSSKLGSQCE